MKGEAVKAIQKIIGHNAGNARPQVSGMAPFWLRDRNHSTGLSGKRGFIVRCVPRSELPCCRRSRNVTGPPSPLPLREGSA
jgi:hypothetical protein